MCDKCKANVFENFDEGCMHEMTCQRSAETVPSSSSSTPEVLEVMASRPSQKSNKAFKPRKVRSSVFLSSSDEESQMSMTMTTTLRSSLIVDLPGQGSSL